MKNPTLAEKRKHHGLHIKPRLYVVLPSHRTSVGGPLQYCQSNRGKSSPATRPAWPLRFLHLHRGGSVEVLGPVQKCIHDTKEQRECESIDVILQVTRLGISCVAMVNCSSLTHTSRSRKTCYITVNRSHETWRASQHEFLTF